MKRKLQDIIQEKFDYSQTCLLLPDMDLKFTAAENEVFEGTFAFHSSSDQEVRGIVSCENPHVTCETREFHGTEIQIRFQYHADAMTEGMTDRGIFVITSNVGEYQLPFRADISRHYLPSSIGRIKTLNDFTNLCKLSWDEALQIFKSPYFVNVLHHDTGFQRLLYRGLTQHGHGAHEMEEFLIGCGKKKRSTITVARPQREYHTESRIQTDFLDIEKSEWGYILIDASCDADFIRLEKHQIWTYDFVGKHAELSYQILPGMLHAGRNFARISLKTAFQTVDVELTVSEAETGREKSKSWKNHKLRAQMERLYLDYRREQVSRDEWQEEMEQLISQAEKLDGKNEWLLLYRMYVDLCCEQKDEAELLSKKVARMIQNQRTPLSAFYLYLATLGETPSYIRDVTKRIREIYLKYPSHPVLVWILLHIDEALLRNPERKYQWIRKYMMTGSASPVFYDEAARILENHPELLFQFDDFERRLLFWMMKHGRLTAQIGNRLFTLMQSVKTFDAVYFQLLCRCYRLVADSNAVKVICMYLIKCNRYGTAYFPWFQKGVTQHLKIAGLYEAYMLSWNKADGMLPEEILRYFSRNSSLPARRKAMFYAYLVKNRSRIGDSWQSYLVLLRNFAKQELAQGHMNEDLAVIYEEVRRQTPKGEWEQWCGNAENCYRIRVLHAEMTGIHVLQDGIAEIQKSPVYEKGSYVNLTRKPFVILYESASGTLYTAQDQFHLKKMMSGSHVFQTQADQKASVTDQESGRMQLSLPERLETFAAPIAVLAECIWQAKNQKIDVTEYEEKLMLHMLFTGEFAPDHEKIFEDLLQKDTDELILQAYAVWFSWKYMRDETKLPEAARGYIGRRMARKVCRQNVCAAAFLRAYAESPEDVYCERAEQVLKMFVLENCFFDFYQKLPERLQRKYLLYAQKTITCVSDPGQYLQLVRLGHQDALRKVVTAREVLPGIYSFTCRDLILEPETYEIQNRDGNCVERGRTDSADFEKWQDTRMGKLGILAQKRDARLDYQYAELTDLADVLFQPVEE